MYFHQKVSAASSCWSGFLLSHAIALFYQCLMTLIDQTIFLKKETFSQNINKHNAHIAIDLCGAHVLLLSKGFSLLLLSVR